MSRALLGAQSYLMLIGACNPMLCQIWGFRFCTLHEFRLGSLTNLDLSFCSLLDPGDASLAELFSRALPNLRGLFVAGCFGQENGVLTIRQIIRRLDLAVLDSECRCPCPLAQSPHLPQRHAPLPPPCRRPTAALPPRGFRLYARR